jgi:hypothetical protein
MAASARQRRLQFGLRDLAWFMVGLSVWLANIHYGGFYGVIISSPLVGGSFIIFGTSFSPATSRHDRCSDLSGGTICPGESWRRCAAADSRGDHGNCRFEPAGAASSGSMMSGLLSSEFVERHVAARLADEASFDARTQSSPRRME